MLWNEAKLLASCLHRSTEVANDVVSWREDEESLSCMRMYEGGEKTEVGALGKEGEAAREEYNQQSWEHPLTAHTEHLIPLRAWLEVS